ncbi:MAG: LVIVD repeat-containing protein [bacterium]
MKQKVKCNVIETTIIIMITCILLCLSRPIKAQYSPFSYLSPALGNPGLFQSPSFLTGFPITGYAPGFSGANMGSYYGYNPYNPYGNLYGAPGSYYPYYPSYTSFPAPPPLPVGNIETVRAMEAKGIYIYYIFEEAYSDGVTIPSPEITLQIADVSDPDDPDIIKSISLDYPVSDIFLHGDYLYWISDTGLEELGYNLNDDEYILGVFDISDPDSPTEMDTLKLTFSSQGAPVFSFNENRLYILYQEQEEDWDDEIHNLITIDISDPGDLTKLSTGEIELDGSIIHDMTVRDNLAILSKGYIMDISDPKHPYLVSEVEDNGSHLGRHAVYGNYLLLTAEEEGLWIVDIEDPSQPEFITKIELAWPKDIIIKDQLAYISDYCKGLNVVDLTDPEDPELIHGYRLPSHKMYRSTSNSTEGWLNDMDMGEGLALTLSYSNIQIWDISEKDDVQMVERIGSSHEQEDLTKSIIPGKLVLLLSHDAIDLLSIGQDGGIATFGIDSLDELNEKYNISKITKETSSWEIPAIMSDYDNYSKRTFSIEFPGSVNMYDIWDDYMDNPYCLIAEFLYTPDPYSNGIVVGYGGGYYGLPFPGGYGLGGIYGPGGYGMGFGAFNPYGYTGIPYQGTNLLLGPFGLSGTGYSPYGLTNPFQYGTGMPGIISSIPWNPISSLFPGGNWQFPNQSYWPGSLFSGTNIYNPIYPGGNYSMYYPFI